MKSARRRLILFSRSSLLLVLCFGPIAAGLATAAAAHCGETMEYSFSNGLQGQSAIRPLGPDALKVSKADERGVVVTLSKDRSNFVGVGGELMFQVHADFEITLKYTILSVELPPSPSGCGVSLTLRFDDDNKTGVSITRLRKPTGEVFGASKITVDAEGKDKYDTLNTPALSKSGAIRLKRYKKTLHFLVSDGTEEFREIRSIDIVTDDVRTTRFQCTTGNQPGGVRARLESLTVRADDLPNEPTTTNRSGRSALKWLLIGGAVIAIVGLYFYFRRRSRQT